MIKIGSVLSNISVTLHLIQTLRLKNKILKMLFFKGDEILKKNKILKISNEILKKN